jgi:hypothetical protein
MVYYRFLLMILCGGEENEGGRKFAFSFQKFKLPYVDSLVHMVSGFSQKCCG